MQGKLLDVFECKHENHDTTTLAECENCPDFVSNSSKRELLLVNKLCPGDALVMTAAIESLHLSHPGIFRTAVRTSCDAIFENNPYVVKAANGMEEIEMEYELIHHSNQRASHFMQGYCDYLSKVLGIKVPLLTNKPSLFLSNRERTWINQVEEITKEKTRFWLINAGYKNDYTTKNWGIHNYQKVVDLLKDEVQFVQIGAKEHNHVPLQNVIDLIGKTTHRQLIRLVYHSAGGLGPSTFLQHLCAAWQKPYVCLLGGREPLNWVQYPIQTTMHTLGMLKCCAKKACWKSRAVRLFDGDEKDESLCELPIGNVPKCMEMITAEQVAEKIRGYWNV